MISLRSYILQILSLRSLALAGYTSTPKGGFIDARGDAGFVQWMATASVKGVLGDRRIGLHQGDQ
jgi:hypothetical protein